MRFVVYGAGAIGGLIGARLHDQGQEVVLIARGEHLAALRDRGLTVRTAHDARTHRVPVAGHPGELRWRDDDVVLLCVKSQDTPDALAELAGRLPADAAVVCVQNGVANERAALRLFRRVYGCLVVCPAEHLRPGVVRSFATDPAGILDLGRYPARRDDSGAPVVDDGAAAIAAALVAAGFDALPRAEIMPWKYRKLVHNLGNAVKALCGPDADAPTVRRLLAAEADAGLSAAGIDIVPAAEFGRRQAVVLRPAGDTPSTDRGGSSWQSLQRRTGRVETDYLNGEIVLLGREHGVPTPMNEVLQQQMTRAARDQVTGGGRTEADLLALLPGTADAGR